MLASSNPSILCQMFVGMGINLCYNCEVVLESALSCNHSYCGRDPGQHR